MNEEYAPLVSIILPTYNGEKYVRDTIQSLVSQTYKNIELVISDDGSTDSTADIIQEYAEKYPFIKVNISPKNLGIAANYNLAVRMATGEVDLPPITSPIWSRVLPGYRRGFDARQS